MPYQQTTPIIDFTVLDTHNPLTMAVADTSFYPNNFNIINPTIEITPPGFSKLVTTYSPGAISMFNSNILQITCVGDINLLTPLPDGIWDIKISISPPISWFSEKQFLRTEKLQQKLGRAFLKVDLTQCNSDSFRENMKAIDEANFYIQAAIAAGNQCNYILAMDLYRTANIMLDHFLAGRCRGTTNTLWC
jgi:hypothetical protein